MVHHIVMWKLRPEADGRSKAENAKIIQQRLSALPPKIDCIQSLRVGVNENGGAWDVVLVTTFQTAADLAAYDSHPDHQAVKRLIQTAAADRACIDFTD